MHAACSCLQMCYECLFSWISMALGQIGYFLLPPQIECKRTLSLYNKSKWHSRKSNFIKIEFLFGEHSYFPPFLLSYPSMVFHSVITTSTIKDRGLCNAPLPETLGSYSRPFLVGITVEKRCVQPGGGEFMGNTVTLFSSGNSRTWLFGLPTCTQTKCCTQGCGVHHPA